MYSDGNAPTRGVIYSGPYILRVGGRKKGMIRPSCEEKMHAKQFFFKSA